MKVIINKDTETPGNIDVMITECTPEEAGALLHICNNIGGVPAGIRGQFTHTEGLQGELLRAGVRTDALFQKYVSPKSDGIYFNPK